MTGALPSLADDLALICEAAAAAAETALIYFRRKPDVTFKGDSSPVSEADLAIDRQLHDMLRAARPTYGWLSEERPDDGSRHAAMRSFVVDPIDGTRAFIAEGDEWCISIGLVENGRPVAGVLHCPSNGDVYAAAAGTGATLNGKPMQSAPSAAQHSSRRIACIPHIARALEPAIGPFARVAPGASLALRLAHVATGRLDATIVKPRAALWDVAAADALLSESGAALRTMSGALVDYGAADAKLPAMMAARPPHDAALMAVVPLWSIG